ncbi:hypothetical_protein [Candidozyma auris]|uniref:hypothetical_protein n=1 Tax=Candidozyma auris TaxID=498019 RepID=UPI000D2E08FE|nr:hypothetical_protein [[Candida] auris]QEO22539.1 hypothetical_protein [[Candida] auris]GBL51053.1 hypothetical protein CAJCM15448_33270 [[Candida] auris]
MLRSLRHSRVPFKTFRRAYTAEDPRQKFLQEYKVRASLERLIHHYASQPLEKLSISAILEQSRKLNSTYILQSARETIEQLLTYNARRLRQFRDLPYLVMLNPSISESYNMYLKTMSVLITASIHPPCTLEESQRLRSTVLQNFMEIHADALPTLSKGFSEVLHLLSVDKVKSFLDEHLRERISMRLIAHQQISLTDSLTNGTFKEGSPHNGIVKPLNIKDVIMRNAELVNDICLMKYDQSVKVTIDTNLHPPNFWTSKDEPDKLANEKDEPIIFPYIEYHLDYILMELFKNSFRAHIENGVKDPVQVTVSTSDSPSFLEMRIRDKGKGIPPHALSHVFDYSFSTYDSGEGDSYKTLNVPPGEAGHTVAGMGYGLPLSKNYIEIFNDTLSDKNKPAKGSLTVQSYYGWGTDVYLKTVGS